MGGEAGWRALSVSELGLILRSREPSEKDNLLCLYFSLFDLLRQGLGIQLRLALNSTHDPGGP